MLPFHKILIQESLWLANGPLFISLPNRGGSAKKVSLYLQFFGTRLADNAGPSFTMAHEAQWPRVKRIKGGKVRLLVTKLFLFPTSLFGVCYESQWAMKPRQKQKWKQPLL